MTIALAIDIDWHTGTLVHCVGICVYRYLCMGVWVYGYLCMGIWLSEYLGVWVYRYMGVWVSGGIWV